MTAPNAPPRKGPALRWRPRRQRELIATYRAYRLLKAHYRVRRRLMPQVWKGPLVHALFNARHHGMPLRDAVAQMARDLRRLQRETRTWE